MTDGVAQTAVKEPILNGEVSVIPFDTPSRKKQHPSVVMHRSRSADAIVS